MHAMFTINLFFAISASVVVLTTGSTLSNVVHTWNCATYNYEIQNNSLIYFHLETKGWQINGGVIF